MVRFRRDAEASLFLYLFYLFLLWFLPSKIRISCRHPEVSFVYLSHFVNATENLLFFCLFSHGIFIFCFLHKNANDFSFLINCYFFRIQHFYDLGEICKTAICNRLLNSSFKFLSSPSSCQIQPQSHLTMKNFFFKALNPFLNNTSPSKLTVIQHFCRQFDNCSDSRSSFLPRFWNHKEIIFTVIYVAFSDG